MDYKVQLINPLNLGELYAEPAMGIFDRWCCRQILWMFL
jgi:hypothetical protein